MQKTRNRKRAKEKNSFLEAKRKKCVQKEFDMADIVRDVRFVWKKVERSFGKGFPFPNSRDAP
jgi:hypothetical protein